MNTPALQIDETDFEKWSSAMKKSSNLDELFGISSVSSNDLNNESLKYQPVKETTTTAVVAAAAKTTAVSSWSTLLAKVVTAYKQNESIGKVGAALLKNAENDLKKIIIYKSKSQVLANCSLDKNAATAAEQIYQQNGFLQFYADDGVFFSIKFERAADEAEFIAKLVELQVLVQQRTENTQVQVQVSKKPAKAKKPTLIARMTKMGGQQLPKLTAATTAKKTSSESSDADELELITTPMAAAINPLNSDNTANAVNVYSATTCQLGMETQLMQMLLSENRTQNTEMRINLNKLELKVEQLSNKLATVGTVSAAQTDKEDELLELESKLLELKKENRKLRQSLETGRQESNSRQLQTILRAHEGKLQQMNIQVSDVNVVDVFEQVLQRLHTRQLETEELSKKNAQLQEDLKMAKCKTSEEQQSTVDLLAKLHDAEAQTARLQQTLEAKDSHILELQHKMLEQQKLHAEKLEQQKLQSGGSVKAIMNNLYVDLTDQIVTLERLQKDELLTLIGKSIKQQTLKVIE